MLFWIDLILNGLLFLFGIIGCVREYKREGIKITRYYTFDSNVLGMIAGGCMFLTLILGLRENLSVGSVVIPISEAVLLPQWVMIFKYIATGCLTLTFLVVIFVLCPMMGGYKEGLIKENLIYQHTLCPIIAIVSFLIFDPTLTFSWQAVIWAWIPTAIYAVVTIILNVLKLLEGPYPFLYVYRQPWYASVAWGIGIVGADFLMVLGLLALKQVL